MHFVEKAGTNKVNRRQLLECAAILVSGAAVNPRVFALNSEQLKYLGSAPAYANRSADYFSDSQRRIVAAIANTIIPRTATPGALEAGVPGFIELMVAEWFNEQERTIFDSGLDDMEQRVPVKYGRAFDQLSPEDQLAELEYLEELASSSDWYKTGNVRRAFVSDAPFICQIKELTIWGFFTSEPGVNQTLRYNPMPMAFDGHFPRTESDSAWAPFNFYR